MEWRTDFENVPTEHGVQILFWDSRCGWFTVGNYGWPDDDSHVFVNDDCRPIEGATHWAELSSLRPPVIIIGESTTSCDAGFGEAMICGAAGYKIEKIEL